MRVATATTAASVSDGGSTCRMESLTRRESRRTEQKVEGGAHADGSGGGSVEGGRWCSGVTKQSHAQ